jgi:hypothetical protein
MMVLYQYGCIAMYYLTPNLTVLSTYIYIVSNCTFVRIFTLYLTVLSTYIYIVSNCTFVRIFTLYLTVLLYVSLHCI